MYQTQKGFWPTLTFILGMLIGGAIFLVMVFFLFNMILTTVQMISLGFFLPSSLVRYLTLFLFYSFLLLVGYVFMAFFPAVRLSEDGLEYRTLFIRRKVNWVDMVSLENTRWPKRAKALVIIRKRKNVLRYIYENTILLYPNQTHGLMAGVHEPVILLTPSLPNRELILAEIQKHLPPPRDEKSKAAQPA